VREAILARASEGPIDAERLGVEAVAVSLRRSSATAERSKGRKQ